MFQKNRKRKISSEDLVFKDEEPQRKSARQQRNEEKKAAEKRAAEAAAAAKSNSGKGAYFKDDRIFWAFFDPLPPLNAK